MNIPFSIATSAILSLASIHITSATLMAMDFAWATGVLALSSTLLFSIAWPCSALASARKILDDRLMSVEEVASQSHGTMPEPVLRGIYRVCVALLYASLCMLAIGNVSHWFQDTSDLNVSAEQVDFSVPLVGGSIAGLISSTWMSVIQARKIRSLMRLSMFFGLDFLLLGAFAIHE